MDETVYWFELLVEAEIVPANKLESLQQETEELIAIFTTVVKKVKSKDDGRRMREEGSAWEVDEIGMLEYSDDEDTNTDKIKPETYLEAQ